MFKAATLAPHTITSQEIEDRAALEHLASAYGHAIDRRDYALLQTLYHEDAIDNHAPYFTGSARDFIAWLPGMLAKWSATSHIIMSRLYLIEGDAAEGELAVLAYHRTLDGMREFIAHGRYLDRYEKRAGVWRFSYRTLVMDWSEDRQIARRDSEAEGVALGQAGPDDPCYEFLPRMQADRSAREKQM